MFNLYDKLAFYPKKADSNSVNFVGTLVVSKTVGAASEASLRVWLSEYKAGKVGRLPKDVSTQEMWLYSLVKEDLESYVAWLIRTNHPMNRPQVLTKEHYQELMARKQSVKASVDN